MFGIRHLLCPLEMHDAHWLSQGPGKAYSEGIKLTVSSSTSQTCLAEKLLFWLPCAFISQETVVQ